MPGLHIRTVPDDFDCEDIGASLLVHWGVPASVTVYRRVELLYADTKRPVTDRFGLPVNRHRWRRVDFDLSGEPQRAVLSVMTQFTSAGVRESRSFSYEHERKLASAFAKRIYPQLKAAADADEAASTPAAKGVADDDAATVQEGGQVVQEADEADEEAAEDDAAEADEEAAEEDLLDEDTSRLAWGCADLIQDNVIYRPVGKNFAIMRMHKWYPHTEGVRYEILQDQRVSLTVESNSEAAATTPGQRPWTFFMVGLGRNVRMD